MIQQLGKKRNSSERFAVMKYHVFDFKRSILDKEAIVKRIEYDPNSSSLNVIYQLLFNICYALWCITNSDVVIPTFMLHSQQAEQGFVQFYGIVSGLGQLIPQLSIQIFIIIAQIDIKHRYIVYVSITAAVIDLFFNYYHLKQKSNFYKISMIDYCSSIQLNPINIPINKIEKGHESCVNLGNFEIDCANAWVLMKSLSSPQIILNSIEITIDTLRYLDVESCLTLAKFLKRQKINVLTSQQVLNTNQIYQTYIASVQYTESNRVLIQYILAVDGLKPDDNATRDKQQKYFVQVFTIPVKTSINVVCTHAKLLNKDGTLAGFELVESQSKELKLIPMNCITVI